MKRPLTDREIETLRRIRNFLAHNGRTPSIRELMTALKYKSPHSAAVIVDRLVAMGLLSRKSDGSMKVDKPLVEEDRHAQTVDIPLVGRIAAGSPLFAEENIEAHIAVSTQLARPPHKYFLLRVNGDSMNQAGIDDGDFILVKQQPTANNGEKIVALIDDEATVKEFQRGKDAVVLKPKSNNTKHKPIILTRDFLVQGVVVATIPKI
ncbi:MAG: repressor LexA [Ignavibacteriae bacterium]|nr:repressor LexA [Ignavibacteria bacterium]MBI3365282.1 repressor LexA [Ignavibacteriota bacterium]